MPDRELTKAEREEMMATVVLTKDRKDVDPKLWTPAHVALIKAAAEDSGWAHLWSHGTLGRVWRMPRTSVSYKLQTVVCHLYAD
jgi:hypothetical protein